MKKYRPVLNESPVKSKSASKVLQLMDKDWDYMDAVKKVSKEDRIPIEKLEKELEVKNHV